ncbi:helix-turn-helix domain-containing protein [Nonomuraea sp. FMUSA5-5]|uniref:Helix-turn-helix domain-containing protein n=1 Tax=Nonomuraea composti TaxID=2720023 RepID=A0ABX1BDV5_9ACTN|nr:helix-turn-helix domain-containing protein [Nonomuraea sp. FMUSA5-5]NJP93946.1 helix-turn-helix domain-containing protein [Nonomuraea sp. FMUSA5-5]
MSELMDVVTLVRDALDIPEGATPAGAKIRGKVLRARADRALALLDACIQGEDTAAAAGELRDWMAKNPIRYVTAEEARRLVAAQDVAGEPLEEVRAGSAEAGVLPLPRRGLPPWMGPSYLARLWSVHPSTVTRWSDLGLLTASWSGGARRFSREAVHEFVRYAVPVRLLTPGMVVQHPEWAEGMPVRIASADEGGNGKWQVTYTLYSSTAANTAVQAAPPCRGGRMVLRYPGHGLRTSDRRANR